MRRIERGDRYPALGRGADPDVRDLADALQSAMRDEYADASDMEMQDALENVLDALSPAEAFDFGSALSRIAKGANQVLSDPTFAKVAGTALPIAGRVVGGIYGGPAGAAIGGNLGTLAAGALPGRPAAPPRVPAPMAPMAPAAPGPAPAGAPPVAPPTAAPAAPASPVAGGSTAATQAFILTQQPDALRSLLATALGWHGRKDVSGIPNAQVLAQLSRLFGQAAADADELLYLEQEADSTEAVPAPTGRLYADLLGADNLELVEAEWAEPY